MLLRLEFLFEHASHTLADKSGWGSRQSLGTLLEILEVLSRGDVKAEVHKELERQLIWLGRLESSEEVDRSVLRDAQSNISESIQQLHGSNTRFGHYLKGNEFITAVRSRSSLPGGLCEFDVPAYHIWLEGGSANREGDLVRWYEPLWLLRDAISVSLDLTRSSAAAITVTAEKGNYTISPETQQAVQMLQIGVPPEHQVFPAVSGGRHRISIRFLEQPSTEERAKQHNGDVPFSLVMCSL